MDKNTDISTNNLTLESITFGKYKGSTLTKLLRDRQYCKWLVDQEWFKTGYEYLYNKVKNYNPLEYFLVKVNTSNTHWLDTYQFFHLVPVEDLQIQLDTCDKICYIFYLEILKDIKYKIYERLENEEENPYDIKAPVKWLQRFEKENGIPRTTFKEFITAYDLPNITSIIEDIKKQGGIEYKGAKSYIIAKDKSKKQENWWEKVLKEKYGELLSPQFKYKNCFFDFLNIKTNTIFEVKLGLKDFNEEQHTKYRVSLKHFRIIYLIDIDCVIQIEKNTIYTTNPDKYELYIRDIPNKKKPTYLDKIISDFQVIKVDDITTLFG